VTVAASSRGSLLRGFITGGLGLMVAYVGYNDVVGGERFTLGIEYLWDGIHLVPALIGLFAVAEMIISWSRAARSPATRRQSRSAA